MKRLNKKDWIKFLSLYGSDFSRWPQAPDGSQALEIRASQEYREAQESDLALNAAAWPSPAEGLYMRTLEKIRQEAEEEEDIFYPPLAAPALAFMQRPLLFACVALMALGLGFSSGTQYNSLLSQNTEYSYFSIGSAYTYNTAREW